MALMLGKLYDALLGAGATPEQARNAAEEVAGYEKDLAAVRADLSLLKWMVAANFAGTIAILVRVFFPATPG